MKINLNNTPYNISTNGRNIKLDEAQNVLLVKKGVSGFQQLDYIDVDDLDTDYFKISRSVPTGYVDAIPQITGISLNILSSITQLDYIDTFKLNIVYDKLILNDIIYIRSNINKLCWINNSGQMIYQASTKLNPNIGDTLYTDAQLSVIAGTVSDIILNNTKIFNFTEIQPGIIYLSNGIGYIRNRLLDNHNIFAWTNESAETIYTNKYNLEQIFINQNISQLSELTVSTFTVPKWQSENIIIDYYNNDYSLITITLQDNLIDNIICEKSSTYIPFPMIFNSIFTHIFELEFDMNAYTQLNESKKIATTNTIHTISKQYTENMYTKAQINAKLAKLQQLINNQNSSSNITTSATIPTNIIYYSYDDSVYEDNLSFESQDGNNTITIQYN